MLYLPKYRGSFLIDKVQASDLLMQSAQTRLTETVSGRKVTSSICKPLYPLSNKAVALYKPPHQEYNWEENSWCPIDAAATGMLLLMAPGSTRMSFSRLKRRYLHKLVHTPVSIVWLPISPLSESETHLGLTWQCKSICTQQFVGTYFDEDFVEHFIWSSNT